MAHRNLREHVVYGNRPEWQGQPDAQPQGIQELADLVFARTFSNDGYLLSKLRKRAETPEQAVASWWGGLTSMPRIPEARECQLYLRKTFGILYDFGEHPYPYQEFLKALGQRLLGSTNGRRTR